MRLLRLNIPTPSKSSHRVCVTKSLQVAPVFCVSGLPNTPDEDDTYEGPGNSYTRKEVSEKL